MMGREMLAGAVEEGVGGPSRETKEPHEELVCRERLPVFQYSSMRRQQAETCTGSHT